MREYYTIKEAAYLLGVSKETILSWITKGQLTACEIKKELDFNEQVDMPNNRICCYAIFPDALDTLDISNSLLSDCRVAVRDRQELTEYLDYLDKKYADLCSELDDVSKFRNHLRKIESYL